MADVKTCVTEIYTALGICSQGDESEMPNDIPQSMRNVSAETWDSIRQSALNAELGRLSISGWKNGRAFLDASEGLRGVAPFLVEWKGPHRPPGYEYLPADLRVNHVYLISCKYGSKILVNTSPANLFDRCLSSRHGHLAIDWFQDVSPDAYHDLYSAVRHELGCTEFPDEVKDLTSDQRDRLRLTLSNVGLAALQPSFRAFSRSVAEASCTRWRANLKTKISREQMLWRLLRLADAPYFILGVDAKGAPIRVRVGTPWDWRQHFELLSFEVTPGDSGQPTVNWNGAARELSSGKTAVAKGHIEIRWSHGRFKGHPEAKVYLDVPHDTVPGYFTLRNAEV